MLLKNKMLSKKQNIKNKINKELGNILINDIITIVKEYYNNEKYDNLMNSLIFEMNKFELQYKPIYQKNYSGELCIIRNIGTYECQYQVCYFDNNKYITLIKN